MTMLQSPTPREPSAIPFDALHGAVPPRTGRPEGPAVAGQTDHGPPPGPMHRAEASDTLADLDPISIYLKLSGCSRRVTSGHGQVGHVTHPQVRDAAFFFSNPSAGAGTDRDR